MVNVLLIDGHDRRALASMRSLGESLRYRVYTGSNQKFYASKHSTFCAGAFSYRNPDLDINGFLEDINCFLKSNDIKVLIPLDDRMATYVAKHRSSFYESTQILLPDWDIFKIARNKALTLAVARDIGIPIPTSYSIEEALTLDDGAFPLIIKPTVSSASIGMAVVNGRSELESKYAAISRDFPSPLIQEMILPGGHYQANMVFDQSSNLVCSSVKNKIREFPLTGGPSTFFRTVDYPIVEEYAEKLLKKLKWVGPAEVEFMVNPRTNEPTLMEINPRMSATIVLSIKAGINFPEFIVKCALNQNDTFGLKNMNFNLFCQWLIPGDMSNFIFNKNRFKDPFGYFFKKKGIICHHMTYDKNDLYPFFVNLFIVMKSAFSPSKIKKFLFR